MKDTAHLQLHSLIQIAYAELGKQTSSVHKSVRIHKEMAATNKLTKLQRQRELEPGQARRRSYWLMDLNHEPMKLQSGSELPMRNIITDNVRTDF